MIAVLAALAGWAFGQAAPYRYATPDEFGNVEVAFTMLQGVDVGLRRRAPSYLYDVGLRGGVASIKKELPGGPTGGAFYDLVAPAGASVAPRERIRATVVDEADGSVRLSLYAGGRLLLSAVDDGTVAGPPIRGAGAVVISGGQAGAPFDDLAIAALPGARTAPLDAASDAAAKAPQKFLSPALADGVNDAAFFGPAAAHVTIFDLRGRRVFDTGGPGGLRWDGRDQEGRLTPSGVYVARIRKTNGRTCYQSFAVVK